MADSNFVKAALAYIKAGYSIIPINVEGKLPFKGEGWNEFKNRLPTEQEIRAWDARLTNPGLAMIGGEVSGNIAIFDSDAYKYPAIAEKMRDKIEALNTTIVKSARNGRHVWLRTVGNNSGNKKFFAKNPETGKVVQIADLKGTGGYVLVPPTAGYETVKAVPKSKLLQVDNAIEWIVQFHKDCGVELVETNLNRPMWNTLIERDLDTGERDDTLHSYACHFWHDGHSPEHIFRLIKATNLALCHPPLPDTDIVRIVESAVSNPRGGQNTYASVQINTIRPEMPPDLVEQLVPQGLITILYGDGGNGKSYVATRLALCVATGEPFFGCRVKKSNVLFLDWEMTPGLSSYRTQKVAEGMGMHSPPDNLWYSRVSGKTPFAELAKAIERDVTNKNIGLVIIDSFEKMATGNDVKDDAPITELMDLLESFGVTVLIIDHIAKSKETTISLPSGNQVPYPFGSVFKGNMSRSLVYVERISNEPGRLDVGLTQSKANNSWLKHPMFLTLTFEPNEIRFTASEQNPLDALKI